MACSKVAATATGSCAVLPSECLDAILASLPPNCMPLAMRQLSKAWRQRFLQHTTVDAKGTTYLPAWAVLQALGHVDQHQQWQLLPALASRGDLQGMQQLQRLHPLWECALSRAMRKSVYYGHLDVLKWLVQEQGCQKAACHGTTLREAVAGGHVHIIQWLHENGCSKLWTKLHMLVAAGAGHLTLLQHMKLLGFPWHEHACEVAATGGHLEVLQYLKSTGCVWDKTTCARAAEGGQLETLRYLRDNGCPWDESAFTFAAAHGQLETLRWLRDNGYPWDVNKALRDAAGSSSTTVEVLQYLLQSGAVLAPDVMTWAVACGKLRTVQWLHEQGCPWCYQGCALAAQCYKLDTLQYLMEHGCP